MNEITTTTPDFETLAFPLIVVKYYGPTDTLGSRYVATLKRYGGMSEGTRTLARVTVGINGSRELSTQAHDAARAVWAKYGADTDGDPTPRAFVPVAMWDGSTGFAVVPVRFFGGTK